MPRRCRVPGGSRVWITVTDTGEGIAPGHLSHVFERFYRAAPARDAAHGGTLTADSGGPGAGARFTMTLPAGRAG